jgi:predicted small metal-binding protein
MKKFACRDIGLQCGFVTEDANEEMLLKKIEKHAMHSHGMQQIDAETIKKVKVAIKDA